MSAPSSTTTRVSPVVRRSIARGSALGVGLLVAAGALAPAALADDETTGDTLTPEVDLETAEIQLVPINEDPLEADENADRTLMPDFGVGKSLDVQITADPIPDDLDLSGAVFDVLDLDGNFQGSCETDVDGLCTVISEVWVGSEYAPAGDEIVLPMGTYTLVQDAEYPVPGLVPSDAVTTFSICFPLERGCGLWEEWDVANDSLFRTDVVVTVRDGGSGRDDAPVAGAGYTLAGPDYRHAEVPPFEILQAGDPSVEIPRIEIPRIEVPEGEIPEGQLPEGEIPEGDVDDTDVAAAVEATDQEGPADADTGDRETGEEPVLDEPVVSGADGVLTYSGFFIEGDYTLTPEVTPSGYVSSGVVPFTIERSESGTVAPWDVTVHLQPENSEGTGGDGTDGSGTGGSGTTPPGVTVPTSSGPGAASPAAPGNPAPGRNRQPAVDAQAGTPAEPSAAEAAPASTSSPAPATSRPVGKPADAGIGPAVATPQIQEASNPTLFKAGLVGFGILFIAIVVIATGFVRRRARHHG